MVGYLVGPNLFPINKVYIHAISSISDFNSVVTLSANGISKAKEVRVVDGHTVMPSNKWKSN